MPYEIERQKAAVGYSGGAGLLGPRERLSQKEQLVQAKEALEAHLKKVNDALAALEEHPEIERVMTLVSQALY